jgi:predicted TIM-barrel fold metal-dependent hydrolase
MMGHLREDTRRKVLGLNAARFFRFDIPEKYKARLI